MEFYKIAALPTFTRISQRMTETRRLGELDALRGLAALSVCLFHFSAINHSSLFPLKVFRYGATGVDLFFTISGFVIYLSAGKAKTGREFWISRFIRLYPAYWLSIIVAILASLLLDRRAVTPGDGLGYLTGNFLMLQPLFKSAYLVQAYWTLYVELCFYLFITIVKQLKVRHRIEPIIGVCLLAELALNSAYLLAPRTGLYAHSFVIARNLVPLISYFGFFSSGIIYYKIYTEGFTLCRVLLLLFGFSLVPLIHPVSGLFNLFFGAPDRLICAAVINLLFVLFVTGKIRFLRTRLLYFFGAISYALYLVHESFGQAADRFLLAHFHISPTAGIVAGISLSVALATLITYGLERPTAAFLKKHFH
jgi:peptidoglycan/LPS O-acetylase OafA/YrhL